MEYVNKISEKANVFGDGIAYVQHWDFSRTNMNEESRIAAITKVASICYDNPNVVGKESLYNRLAAESMGLPSSSFEFVPVLLPYDTFHEIGTSLVDQPYFKDRDFTLNIERYGDWIVEDGEQYLLTNYRALLYDWENSELPPEEDFSKFFNNEYECEIINKHHNTFLYKMDMNTSKQHNRHRINLQELSRRYVSGKKTEFEFYISEGMKGIVSTGHHIDGAFTDQGVFITDPVINVTTEQIHEICEAHYFEALKQGVQPQEARRILPQSMYTTIWSAFLPFQLDNYINLRSDGHAQWEIRQLSDAMKEMIDAKKS